ncbi:MAG: hypothetical protein QOE68_892 [Thermoanaerobaculia bacterium]|nr:hypothetical protein [Thermoanaerobaculia bacterium]
MTESLNTLSQLPVEKLSAGEIEHALITRNVDVAALKRCFRKEAARVATPASTPLAKPFSAPTLFIGLGGCGADISKHLYNLLSAYERPPYEIRFLLIDTNFLCDGLRMQKKRGASTQQLARYLHLSIDAVGRCVDRLGKSPDAAFDHVWPTFVSLPRLAAEISEDGVLADDFIDAYARLGSATESRTRCGFAWSLDLLLRGKPNSARFGAKMAARLLERGVDPDTAAVLYMMFDLRPSARSWMPHAPMDAVVPTAAAAWKSFVREARTLAIDASLLIRRRRKRQLTASEVLGSRFVDLFDAMRDDIPLHSMFGMGASKLALTLIGTALRDLPESSREAITGGICSKFFDDIAARPGHSAFLTIEALEGLRDALPAECSKVLPAFAGENMVPYPSHQPPLVIRTKGTLPSCDVRLLDDAFWDCNMPRLLAYANSAVRAAKWRGARGELPAGANSPSDYVLEAATLVLRGDRQCPVDVSPVRFILVVIRTLIRRDRRERENRTSHEFITVLPKSDGSAGGWEKRMACKPFIASADEMLAARELVEDFKEMLPDEYRSYVDVLACDAYPTRHDRADALGLPENEIRSMDKNIRKLRSLWKGIGPTRKMLVRPPHVE